MRFNYLATFLLTATTLLAGAALVTSGNTAKAGGLPYGPDTCKQGYVWREAVPNDHVCVIPRIRSQAAYDNSQAAYRIQPGGGAYGAFTCRQGYVWREAVPGDYVCVIPQVRSQAAYDNAQAKNRRASNRVPIDNGTQLNPVEN